MPVAIPSMSPAKIIRTARTDAAIRQALAISISFLNGTEVLLLSDVAVAERSCLILSGIEVTLSG